MSFVNRIKGLFGAKPQVLSAVPARNIAAGLRPGITAPVQAAASSPETKRLTWEAQLENKFPYLSLRPVHFGTGIFLFNSAGHNVQIFAKTGVRDDKSVFALSFDGDQCTVTRDGKEFCQVSMGGTKRLMQGPDRNLLISFSMSGVQVNTNSPEGIDIRYMQLEMPLLRDKLESEAVEDVDLTMMGVKPLELFARPFEEAAKILGASPLPEEVVKTFRNDPMQAIWVLTLNESRRLQDTGAQNIERFGRIPNLQGNLIAGLSGQGIFYSRTELDRAAKKLYGYKADAVALYQMMLEYAFRRSSLYDEYSVLPQSQASLRIIQETLDLALGIGPSSFYANVQRIESEAARVVFLARRSGANLFLIGKYQEELRRIIEDSKKKAQEAYPGQKGDDAESLNRARMVKIALTASQTEYSGNCEEQMLVTIADKRLEIVAFETLIRLHPKLAQNVSSAIPFYLVDPQDPKLLVEANSALGIEPKGFKALRPDGMPFILGKKCPGRFTLSEGVSDEHLQVTVNPDLTISVKNLDSKNITMITRFELK